MEIVSVNKNPIPPISNLQSKRENLNGYNKLLNVKVQLEFRGIPPEFLRMPKQTEEELDPYIRSSLRPNLIGTSTNFF